MSRLQDLYDLTEQLYLLMNKEVTSQNRESVIEEINELIEKREHTLKDLSPPFTDEEQKMGQKVVKLNSVIEEKLENVFSQLKDEMKQMQEQKKSNRTYINPYGPVKTIDGMYVDSKQ